MQILHKENVNIYTTMLREKDNNSKLVNEQMKEMMKQKEVSQKEIDEIRETSFKKINEIRKSAS